MCSLAAMVFLAPGGARAQVVGSRHDFTGIGSALTPTGVCSPCHIAHNGQAGSRLWPRSLVDENNYFNQRSNPNYAPGATVLCYDCHDNHRTSGGVNDNPPDAWFNSSRLPQDVAFDDDMKSTVPRDGMSNDNIPGYYGNIPSRTEGYPVTGSGASTYISGHYVKTIDPSLSVIKSGDKLPCADCHDPHGTVNQAFIRANLGGKSVSGKKASKRMAYDSITRDDTDSRNLCIACHGTSEQTSYTAVAFRDVNPSYSSNTIIVKPPTSISAHRSGKTTACTACHLHNGISVSCKDCHGFPPMRTIAQAGGLNFDKTLRPDVENYSGGAGAHQRHSDALGDVIFQCETCHGPDPGSATWHNFGAGVVSRANVDIMGETAYWGAGSSYNGTASGATATHAFAAKGGADGTNGGRCANLICHGLPPNTSGALNWTDKLVDDSTGNPVGDGLSICKWCHDKTPARIGTGPWAPNVLGDNDGATSVWNTGTWGADVNGHGLATGSKYDQNSVGDAVGKSGAGKTCTLCHDARYTTNALPAVNTPIKPHFVPANNDEKRLRGTINGVATADADAACVNCHQVTPGAGESGTQVSTHGNDYAEFAPPGPQGSAIRACRQCHNVHGANWNGLSGIAPDLGRNLYMIGKWVDANGDGLANNAASEAARVDSDAVNSTADITGADLPVVFTRRGTPTTASGDDSFDDGFNDGKHESICVVCHKSALMNPAHKNSTNDAFVQNSIESTTLQGAGHHVGEDCTLCHNHEYDKNSTTADGFAPSGCFACHGTNTTEALQNDPNYNNLPALRGQFWPDGSPALHSTQPQYDYADDQTGAHRRHVESIAWQVYGETAAQVVLDYVAATNPTLSSTDKQKTICAFCHANPGGAGHSTNVNNDPLPNRVNVYGGTAAGDWLRKYVPIAGSRAAYADNTEMPSNGYNFTTQSCASLICHNQTATPASPTGWNAPPTWTAANAACSNIACHATTTYTIAHNTHVNGTPKSYACTECHPDNATVVPVTNPVPLAHGNGEVDMKWDNPLSLEGLHGGNGYYDKNNNTANDPAPGDTGFGYKSGGAVAADPSYARSCYRVYCHGGDNNATYLPNWGGITTSPSSNWNAAGPLACTTCHAAPPPTNRHVVHDNNNAWVPNECGSCHRANNNKTSMTVPVSYTATHVNGTVDMAPAVPYTPPTCTNICHLVSAPSGGWPGANPLPCTDCHSGTYIGTAPTSGLHAATAAMAHDVQFMATAGESPETATCTHCHLATGPSSSHKTGPAGAAPPTQNSKETTYFFNATYMPNGYDNAAHPAATSCQATCHSDNRVVDTNPAGLPASPWKRRWVGVVDAKPLATNNPGDTVCRNCHGDFTNGWNLVVADSSTTSHTNPYDQGSGNLDRMDRHSVCQTCHGWGNANYSATWGDTAKPSHGDGSITMNGPAAVPGPKAGAEYDNATGGCTAACHSAAYVLNTNSGWPVNYGNFGSGACEFCHNGVQTTYPLAPNVMGDGTNASGSGGTTPKPYDDGSFGYNVNGHGRDGTPAVPGNSIDVKCIACHDILVPAGTHLDGVLNGRLSPDTRNANSFHLLPGFIKSSPTSDWDVQLTFDDACATLCHPVAKDMRHPKDGGLDDANKPAVPPYLAPTPPYAAQFGTHSTYDTPRATPPPQMFYDRNLVSAAVLGTYDGIPNFALCVSCHNPHGTTISNPRGGGGTSPRADGNNKMMIYWWENPGVICIRCHSN